jgi:enhancing lycopene biosynthesis protein 2
MSKKIGVLLSGCGVFDGAEIHESVITLLALDRAGAEVTCIAPDKDQMHVVDHQAGSPAEGQTRNVRVESARIARGAVTDVKDVDVDALDAIVLPGGFGAAKNLCTFATEGEACSIDEGVDQLLGKFHAAGKPIGAMCIAPAVLAKHFAGRTEGVKLTIGTCEETGGKLEKLGASHVSAKVDEIVVDEANKLVTTPAYMLASGPAEAASGIEKLVAKVLELA